MYPELSLLIEGQWCKGSDGKSEAVIDPATESEICDEIRALCTERQLTVLAVSHQPRWQQIADYVYYFEQNGLALPAPALVQALPSRGAE